MMVLASEMSNNMKCFRKKQAKKPALRREEAVTDFSEDMVTSWMVADFKSIIIILILQLSVSECVRPPRSPEVI